MHAKNVLLNLAPSDALVKPSLRNSPVLMNSINWVRKKDFTVSKGDCDERSAKSECYDIVRSKKIMMFYQYLIHSI